MKSPRASFVLLDGLAHKAHLLRMTVDAFLRIADQYRLGDLSTEQPHPETTGLAELARDDLPRAVVAFHTVDRLALQKLKPHLGPLSALADSIRNTLDRGGRIFLSGCGATGRLALALEAIAREMSLTSDPNKIIGFMAGGDAALIRSIESFEDYPDYGRRQLKDLGFADGDLLIAITEGGETPFVIGTALEAASFKGPNPWFVFCNPMDILKEKVERSKVVIEHPRIRSFSLPVGPMALSGSTRLQATTTQMLVVGTALFEACGRDPALSLIQEFEKCVSDFDPTSVIPFIKEETAIYESGQHVLYEADLFAITVLTDTTERSPTFSLPPFESRDHLSEPSSPCYLTLPNSPNSACAWKHLLKRNPRALDWEGIDERATLPYLLSHDISKQTRDWRHARNPEREQHLYRIHGPQPVLEFAGHQLELGPSSTSLLLRHLLLKIFLNMQSTLVMGRLGRFESNLMTWVKPANNKLIDRAARYRQNQHFQKTGKPLPYEDAVRLVFEAL